MLRRRHIGFVFQFFNLISNMTVADNVELPALLGGATSRQAKARREELLADLGLSGKAGTVPSRLSGGEQQRVALARALANQPSVLLADVVVASAVAALVLPATTLQGATNPWQGLFARTRGAHVRLLLTPGASTGELRWLPGVTAVAGPDQAAAAAMLRGSAKVPVEL